MTAVTETPTAGTGTPSSAPAEAGAEQASHWAKAYLARLSEATTKRLAQLSAHKNGTSGGIKAEIGEPTVGQYVAFDCAATSPIQITGLPPYQPSKVIAAGEAAFIVVYLWVNPTADIGSGFAVPPTVQLSGRNWRVSLDLTNITDGTRTTLVQSGTYGPVVPDLDVKVFALPSTPPASDAAVWEANVTFHITDPGQPYAAFATNFFDVDDDPAFLFVPPAPAGLRHELPNRYLVYAK
jgi:hypothetical protein